MAQVKGPLFSLSASGKFGDTFEIRKTVSTHQIIPTRKKPDKRSPAQRNQADRFKTAVEAWKAITEPQKAQWNAAAQTAGTIGYRLYVSEYLSQGITPPDQPQIP